MLSTSNEGTAMAKGSSDLRGYRDISHLNELEIYEIILAHDQDLGFFFDHSRQAKLRPFVAIPYDVALILLIHISTIEQRGSRSDLCFTSDHGKRSWLLWNEQEVIRWSTILDSCEVRFGYRYLRVVSKLPQELILKLEDRFREGAL